MEAKGIPPGRRRRHAAPAALGLAAALVAAALVPGDGAAQQGAHVAVEVPAQLSAEARDGEQAFARHCAACHGANGAGSDKGPPLIHDIYNPGHHSDDSFVLAVRRGSRAHHWRYGDMKPLPQVADRELLAIIRYVRELQEANGIVTRPHRM